MSRTTARGIFCTASLIAYYIGSFAFGNVMVGVAMTVSFWVGALIIGLTVS